MEIDSIPQRSYVPSEGKNIQEVSLISKPEAPEDETPYTDGPSRVVLINDGDKGCLAVLLTENMVFAINVAQKIWRDIGSKEKTG